MMEYLDDLSFVLLFSSAFGLIVLVFGYIFEKVVEKVVEKTIGMEKFVNIMFGSEDDEDEEDEY